VTSSQGSNYIDTVGFSARLRSKSIDLPSRKIRITRFTDSLQEQDLSEPANCRGLGRIRHFRRGSPGSWPANPLPIDPAIKALGLSRSDGIRAQAFQNAVCNWRCWYCFVDFELLSGSDKRSEWMSADELLDSYVSEPNPARMIDLTGGQPDLTPEWVLWMMEALEARGLANEVYLWSDDNLSTDYFWTCLGDAERARIANYRMYGRACCFKGFNEESFSFNTRASPTLFDLQFDIASRLIASGIDLYAYVTLTTPRPTDIASDVAKFVDRLQAVHRNLPLRTIPLEIRAFAPVVPRMSEESATAISLQWEAVRCWLSELEGRFSPTERSQVISSVSLG
jgi:uncharacterized Fe-S cluster-containing radical SAM superfamily protein